MKLKINGLMYIYPMGIKNVALKLVQFLVGAQNKLYVTYRRLKDRIKLPTCHSFNPKLCITT